MKEKDLWIEFKKWGDVREVFIANNKNKNVGDTVLFVSKGLMTSKN